MRKMVAGGELDTTAGLTTQEAQAVERCLKMEGGIRAGRSERVRIVYLGTLAPRSVHLGREHELQVRIVERSSLPDQVTLEAVRVLSDEVRRTSVTLERRTLRSALRPFALSELLSIATSEVAPVLGVECSRKTWVHESGWSLSIDRELAFHRVDPGMLERTGQIAFGVPDRILDGRAVLSVQTHGQMVPPWLEQVARSAQTWDGLREGLKLVAPRPGTRTAGDLRLV